MPRATGSGGRRHRCWLLPPVAAWQDADLTRLPEEINQGLSQNEWAEARRGITPDDEKFWRGCLGILQNLKIVDPACGSGAFLFQAYNVLELRYQEVIGHLENCGAADAARWAGDVSRLILEENLYGVDLSPEAVEITQLALWIRSATPGQTLYDYCSRQKIGGVTLNFFIVEQVPTLPPDTYDKRCPWDREMTLEEWISERV